MSEILQVRRRFAAPPDRVFDAWINPAKIRQWFSPELGDMTRVTVDARVGGRFSFMQRRDGEDVDHVGKYLEVDRGQRLVFTWSVPKYSSDSSTVAIDIAPEGTGSLLTLSHEMDDAHFRQWADRTEEGWKHLLEAIATVVGG